MTAVVFNCAYNGLSIIQELGRRGVDVHALDSFRNIGTTSKYATYHKVPNPTTDEEGFIEFLLKFGTEFDEKPVLIPTNDHWASAIANHRERLAEHYVPCVPDGETVDLLLDKQAFGSWAEDRSYPVPRSWSRSEVDEIPEDAFPIAAKPGDARDAPDMMYRSALVTIWNRLTGSRTTKEKEASEELSEEAGLYKELRLEVFEERSTLNDFLETYPELTKDFVFQEYVRGMSDSMYTVGIYANEGTVKGVFTGRKVRGHPADIGDCKVGQIESVPDQLVDQAKSICDELEYTGIAEFEYKRDTVTGDFYLIEVNPRSWSWVGITPACGVNLPWMAYTDLAGTGEQPCPSNPIEDGSITWVKATEDLFNCLLFYRWSYPKWHLGPKKWWRSVNADRTVFAEGSLRDPLPVMYSILLMIRRLVNESRRQLTERQ